MRAFQKKSFLLPFTFWLLCILVCSRSSHLLENEKDETLHLVGTTSGVAESKKAKNKQLRWRLWRSRHGGAGLRRNKANNSTETQRGEDEAVQKKGEQLTIQQHCSASSAFPEIRRRRRRLFQGRNTKETKLAYRMAVLATLAYLPFDHQGVVVGRPRKAQAGAREEEEATFGFRLMRRKRRLRFFRLQLCRVRRGTMELIRRFPFRRRHKSQQTAPLPSSCRDKINQRHPEHERHRLDFDYWFHDWVEPTAVPGVHYHDTDLLVSTSNNNKMLTLAFAGTSSAADHVTNLQTFEKASHSGLFRNAVSDTSTAIEGSLHRGMLNAYSRVDRGSVLRVSASPQNSTEVVKKYTIRSLEERFGHCTPNSIYNGSTATMSADVSPMDTTTTNASGVQKRSNNKGQRISSAKVGRNGVCHSRGEKLMTILREIVSNALLRGRTVHIAGHSLGTYSTSTS